MVNYVGQLRIYSFVDLVLLLAALGAALPVAFGISLLWFGFLIHLEWRHRDAGRLLWPWYAWVIPWIAGAIVLHSVWLLPFFVLAVAYALKKRWPSCAAVSPLLNGGLKVTLVLLIPGVPAALCVLVFVIMTMRNLIGDLRDAGKDAREGVQTIPVLLGYQRHTPWIYPAALALTSGIWVYLGGLPWWCWIGAVLIQAGTYRLTPR
ncbi:hypothetical protein HTZ77_38050 [Nonomuraea sp. SMC257]|uniref:Uncharacterized protein n=1 Tax=Nonomuraea montanisoli TaxID=2741721 RepID=A0A7Y6IFG6_9ACTN|nr:hypothetical protein [Nonomuraea montanisoli]NUW37166.1 hypothetical protein [Nonomuraea montanisoli]